MMKAWRIHGYGAPDVLVCDDMPVPEIGPDEVLIRTYAAGINPADWRTRNGQFSAMRPATFPLTLGLDVAGTVEAAGAQANGFRPGDKAIARAEGALAEFVVARAADVAHAPNSIPLEHAAGIPVAAGTAWLVLFDAAAIRRGQTVLILGASGGIGAFATQLAKRAGARVIGTTSARNADLVRSLGANEVVDYHQGELASALAPVDTVIDLVGPAAQEAAWPLLREGGRFVSIVAPPDKHKAAKGNATAIFGRGPRPIDGSLLKEIVDLVDRQELRVVVEAAFSFSKAPQAISLSESGRSRGKIILTLP
ncbi:NADP-dependent oxidoreductase [Neorhizobium sp. DT-125]|uniref:NADP-dependent oxidoreductase n=1 Tax=Neorhizobium sp. DT-125 TaxID=3396163 RepID=UPI003F1B70E0